MSESESRKPHHFQGLRFDVARSLDEVVAAWGLVYRAYLGKSLVEPHPDEVYTVPQAVGANTVVVCGRIDEMVVSTLSAYHDSAELGLPLDTVYPDELASLRREGRWLMELGLFADRREQVRRSMHALLELMRLACFFGVHTGATDGVIGVFPNHAGFYRRLFGFVPIGPARTCEAYNGADVVLLHLDWYGAIRRAEVPPGLREFVAHPVGAEVYHGRFRPTAAAVAGSPIERFTQSPARASCSLA